MFRFKQFEVRDDLSAMKVGTDGVLLGAWATVESDSTILDVGTGSGLIALMVAQRNPKARITAIDIDRLAVDQARANVSCSPWSGRIAVEYADVRSYEPNQKFDHIVSNPPYFSESQQSPDAARAIARHTSMLDSSALVDAAVRLLNPGGRLSVILPSDVASQMRREAFGRLWLSHQTDIVTRVGDAPRRTMMEFVLSSSHVMPHVDCFAMQCSDGSYSDEYRQLTEEFYLKF